MGGELTKLSETRGRYATGRRVYYIRQMRAPNVDRQELGVYRVDGGRECRCDHCGVDRTSCGETASGPVGRPTAGPCSLVTHSPIYFFGGWSRTIALYGAPFGM